jgi:hypothetical protein
VEQLAGGETERRTGTGRRRRPRDRARRLPAARARRPTRARVQQQVLRPRGQLAACMRQGRLGSPLAPARGRLGPQLGRDGPSPGRGARSTSERRLHGSVLGPPRSFPGFRTPALARFDAWQNGRACLPCSGARQRRHPAQV